MARRAKGNGFSMRSGKKTSFKNMGSTSLNRTGYGNKPDGRSKSSPFQQDETFVKDGVTYVRKWNPRTQTVEVVRKDGVTTTTTRGKQTGEETITTPPSRTVEKVDPDFGKPGSAICKEAERAGMPCAEYIKKKEEDLGYRGKTETKPLVKEDIDVKYITLSFRGTQEYFNFSSENWGDVLTDLYSEITDLKTHFPFIKDEDNLAGHKGFIEALKAIYNNITEQLINYDNHYLDVGGHSLGAGLQTIFCYVYHLDTTLPTTRPRLRYNINFGSPRVFYDEEFEGNRFDVMKYNYQVNNLRVFNTFDIITKLPLPSTPNIEENLKSNPNYFLDRFRITGSIIYDTFIRTVQKFTKLKLVASGFRHIGNQLELDLETGYSIHHFDEDVYNDFHFESIDNMYANKFEWENERQRIREINVEQHLESKYKQNIKLVPTLIGLPFHNPTSYINEVQTLITDEEVFTNIDTHEINFDGKHFTSVKPDEYIDKEGKTFKVKLKNKKVELHPIQKNKILGFMLVPQNEKLNRVVVF